MKRILHLISSIQEKGSNSIQLGNAIIEKIQEKYSGSTVEELNLVNIEIPHLNPAVLRTFFIPGDQLTEEEKASIRFSDEMVKQLLASDIIVIGAPLYNFTIHTALKAWIDHVTRVGITFGYGENGPVGKVTGKKVYVANVVRWRLFRRSRQSQRLCCSLSECFLWLFRHDRSDGSAC
ncbi:FMN-dependent NADH-azoreductase [Chitinophaga sp. 22321]|uniref:FMN-dependent NADH-azoreductase n=1 Tax=Chitinophaga TaxID=79328 RepID=UPI002010D2B3|nr:NAD(P)H-dependent oxidoreductase [Chitinophaga hostae]